MTYCKECLKKQQKINELAKKGQVNENGEWLIGVNIHITSPYEPDLTAVKSAKNTYNRSTTIQPIICQSYKNGHFVNTAKSKT